MINLGPIWILSKRERGAYRKLVNRAYALHQQIWYSDDLCPAETQVEVRLLDTELADAISRVPSSDVDPQLRR